MTLDFTIRRATGYGRKHHDKRINRPEIVCFRMRELVRQRCGAKECVLGQTCDSKDNDSDHWAERAASVREA
jgi:hypothetical protein